MNIKPLRQLESLGVENCSDPSCQGHKASDGRHAHFLICCLGRESVRSLAFGSTGAGEAMADAVSKTSSYVVDHLQLASLMRGALPSANVPEECGNEREFANRCTQALRLARREIGPYANVFDITPIHQHHYEERRVEEGQYTLTLQTCVECGTTILRIYINGELHIPAPWVTSMVIADKLFEALAADPRVSIPSEDLQCLQGRLPELFALDH